MELITVYYVTTFYSKLETADGGMAGQIILHTEVKKLP